MGGIEPQSTVYETAALPLSYTGLFIANKRPSRALLLGAQFSRPFPLLRAANVEFNASQFGQIRRRLPSILFRQLPSIWSATKGTLPVFMLTRDHPHKQHLSSNFLRKYFLMCGETKPILFSPFTLPLFHSLIYCRY